MSVSLSFAAAMSATRGRLLSTGAPPTGHFEGLSIDSRTVPAGAAFVAISGERFDGHDYIAQAVSAGAALLVLQRRPEVELQAPVLLVPDTTVALGQIAQAWLLEVRPKVVGVTGSVGKTTTKELTRNICAQVGPTHATPGNFNNQIGLPLTLLSMPRDTRYLVAELGTNAPGEIAYLAGIARPEVAAITAVAPVHLEGLGSIEAVAAEKAEIWQHLGKEGVAIAPAAEPLLEPHLANADFRCLRFGSTVGADVHLRSVRPRGQLGSAVALELRGEELAIELPLVGVHNAQNAAAAAAIALALGLDAKVIVAGLETRPELGHRSTIRNIGPWYVLDDCYNASPKAMCAALDTLVELAGEAPAYAALGGMQELGTADIALSNEVGAHAASLGLAGLFTVGSSAVSIAAGAGQAGMNTDCIKALVHPEDAAKLFALHAPPGAWLLVKGSRSEHMERTITRLEEVAEESKSVR